MSDIGEHQLPSPKPTPAQIAVYQVAASHWAHAEQVRWMLVYNYSMASTVLLLSWAAVFASSGNPSLPRKPVLVVLAVAGICLTILWLILQVRANGFVHAYKVAGEQAETALQTEHGPFAAAQRHRERASPLGTRYIAPAAIGIFALVYAVLLCISINV